MISKFKKSLGIVGILILVNPLFAQTADANSIPKAVVHLKNNTPNEFIEAVLTIANGDPVLTEKSIQAIINIKQNGNLKIIPESEYDLLPENRKKYFTNQRDLQVVIENQKVMP